LRVLNNKGKFDIGLFVAVALLVLACIVTVRSITSAVALDKDSGPEHFLLRQLKPVSVALIVFLTSVFGVLGVLVKNRRYDIGLFVLVMLLLGASIIMVDSATSAVVLDRNGGPEQFVVRQMQLVSLAMTVFLISIFINYRLLNRYWFLIFMVAVGLLVYVIVMPPIKGVHRWIRITDGLFFQVSDFARVALILFLANVCNREWFKLDKFRATVSDFTREIAREVRALFTKEKRKAWEFDLRRLRPFIPYIGIALICGLVVAGKAFSTTSIIFIIALAMLFVAGAKFRHILLFTGMSALVGALYLFRPRSGGHIAAANIAGDGIAAKGLWESVTASAGYQAQRFVNFLNPSANLQGANYQPMQSEAALGNGGFGGVGLGRGMQKEFHLPEPHTDYMLSIFGEELGFLGIMLLFTVFALIVIKGFSISLKAPDRSGRFIAFGLTFMIAVYVLFHAAVVTRLAPATGVPMPFLSYGGTNLLFTMWSLGILFNISSQIERRKKVRKAEAGGAVP